MELGGVLLLGEVQVGALGLEHVAVRGDADERGAEAVGLLDGGDDLGEHIEVRVDGGIDLGGLDEEEEGVGGLAADLGEDGVEGGVGGVGLLGAGALLDAAGIEDGEGAELALDIEPAALARLGLDVADLGDAGAEEGVDEGGLARAAAADEDEIGRALFEQQGAQVGNLLADVAGERIRDAFEHLLEPADGLGDFLERGFVRGGHGSGSSWGDGHDTGREGVPRSGAHGSRVEHGARPAGQREGGGRRGSRGSVAGPMRSGATSPRSWR